jgi:hypothetical protein
LASSARPGVQERRPPLLSLDLVCLVPYRSSVLPVIQSVSDLACSIEFSVRHFGFAYGCPS